MGSILNSIKKRLGVSEWENHFDEDIIMDINSAFAILAQMGVGPTDGFSICSSSEEWSDYLGDDTSIENVKTYVYLKVKLMFDPPSNSALIEVLNRQISELEWRLNVAKDT